VLFSLQFIDTYKDGVIFCSVYRFVQRWCLSLILFVQVLPFKSTCCYKQTRGRTPSPTCVIDGATFQEDTRWNCSWEYVFWGIFLHFLVMLQFLYFFHITVKLCSHMKLFFRRRGMMSLNWTQSMQQGIFSSTNCSQYYYWCLAGTDVNLSTPQPVSFTNPCNCIFLWFSDVVIQTSCKIIFNQSCLFSSFIVSSLQSDAYLTPKWIATHYKLVWVVHRIAGHLCCHALSIFQCPITSLQANKIFLIQPASKL